MNFLKNLTPALVFLILSILSLIKLINTVSNNVLYIKILLIFLFTMLLHFLYELKYHIISWILVIIPLLLIFGNDFLKNNYYVYKKKSIFKELCFLIFYILYN
jgi:uncharacterized protein YqgC (DUF456 family)